MGKRKPKEARGDTYIPPCGPERTSLRVSVDAANMLDRVHWDLADRLRRTGFAADMSRSIRLTDDDVLRHVLYVYMEAYAIALTTSGPEDAA